MARGWFRADIEGIRGFAMILVLLAHAGFAFAEGGYIGLDLFFVISGFLITTLLLREMDRSGRISLGRFYARRIRRLLPAAALVLVTVVVLSGVLLSPVRNELVAGDVLAAVLYVVNWRLAEQSVDYFAEGFDASPVQHFWSLAVEEQFYIVWPIVIIAVTWWWRRSGGGVNRTALAMAVGAIGLASLAYSVQFTPESPEQAYFSTLTRVWELSLGVMLAIVSLPRLGTRAAGGLAWAGMAAIVGSFLLLDESTPYPGAWALFPTLGAAAIIVAGTSSTAGAPMRLLQSPPLQHVGRVSYCWYLWHWPALIFAASVFGPVSPAQGAALMAASWVPAVLTHHWVEQPFRQSRVLAARPRRAVAVLATGSGAAAVAAIALALAQPSISTAPASSVQGAGALEQDRSVQERAEALRPDPSRAFEDRTRLVDDGCFVKLGDVRMPECAYGDASSSTTVVLFGDSHLEPFFPAFERLAERHGWRLVALTKSFCTPADVVQPHPRGDKRFHECEEWRETMLERIAEEERPDLVVVGGSTSAPVVSDDRVVEGEEAEEALVDGFASTLARLQGEGTRVALVGDAPKAPRDIPECVLEHRERLSECSFPAGGGASAEERAVARVPDAHLVDTPGLICPDDRCRAVIGDAIVYRDTGHLTATFAATLAPMIERELPRLR